MNSPWINKSFLQENRLIGHCHYPSHYQWHFIRFDSWSDIVREFTKWSSTPSDWQVSCWVLWWWHRFKRVIISGLSRYSGKHFIEHHEVIQECYHPSQAIMVINIYNFNTVSVLFPLHHNIIDKHIDVF